MARISAVILISVACLCLPQVVTAADWSDAWIGYRYGSHFSEPGIDKDITKNITKNIVSLTYVNGYTYGGNFFTLDVLKSDSNDPANNSTDGAQQLYLVYRHQLSLAKTTGVRVAKGPLPDLALSAGFDFDSKNTAFAPAACELMIGPTAKFGFAGGWADLSLLYFKEMNHNGIVGTDVTFDPTYRIEGAWGMPIPLGSVSLPFNGFFNYTGEKGKDGFGADTKPETLINAFLMLDAGALAGKPQAVYAGAGYEYWVNMYGVDNAAVPGARSSTAMFKLEWHL